MDSSQNNQPFDPLYRNNSRVKQGILKVKFSTRVRDLVKKIFIILLSFILITSAFIFFLYASLPRARVDNRLVVYSKNTPLDVGQKVVIADSPQFFDVFLYLSGQKEAALMEVLSLPYSMTKINDRVKVLSPKEYHMRCLSKMCYGRKGIIERDKILGVLDEKGEKQDGSFSQIRGFLDKIVYKILGTVEDVKDLDFPKETRIEKGIEITKPSK